MTLKNDATAGNITGFAKVTAKAKDGEGLAIGAISAGTIEDTEMIALYRSPNGYEPVLEKAEGGEWQRVAN